MKQWTKLAALVMSLGMTFSIVACEGDVESSSNSSSSSSQSEQGAGNQGVTEEVWEEAIQEEIFDNVTMRFAGEFVSGATGAEPFDYLCKIDGNSASMNGEAFEPDEVEALKEVYLKTSLAIVENFEDFTYEAETQSYKANGEITYTVNVMGTAATIKVTDAVVKLDVNSRMATIDCTMEQKFTENGNEKTYVLDLTFTYSDYGTTTVS